MIAAIIKENAQFLNEFTIVKINESSDNNVATTDKKWYARPENPSDMKHNTQRSADEWTYRTADEWTYRAEEGLLNGKSSNVIVN